MRPFHRARVAACRDRAPARAVVAPLLALLLLCLHGATTSAQEATTPVRRVLLLHSFGANFAPWNKISGALREQLIKDSPYPIDLYETSLEGDRFGPSQDQTPFADYLHALFADRKLDLIIAMGAPAARFVQKYRPPLFASTPLLLTGADERTYGDIKLTSNDAAVAVDSDLSGRLESILQVLPDTTNIFVLIGSSWLERFWADQYRQAFAPHANRVTFKFSNGLSLDQMMEQAAHLPPHSAIYYATVRTDGLGVPLEEDRFLSRLREVANAPVFTYIDSNFGHGIVGGPMLSTQDFAGRSADAANRILGGESPGDIKTPTQRMGAPIYDARELQRWHISESRLPPGSTVLFREPSAWQTYRWQIVAIAVAGLVLLGLIGGLLYERRRRRLAEIQSQQRASELALVNRHATANELSVSIAHELNQPLGAILLNSETAKFLLARHPPDLNEIRQIIDEIQRDDQRAGDVIRRLRSLLKREPFELRSIDLNETVAEVLELISTTAIERRVNLTKVFAPVPLPISGDSIQLQQVALNLIINGMDAMTATNGAAREIVVRTTRSRDCAELTISDSGAGIPPEIAGNIFNPFFTTKKDGMGMGLSIARTIVEAHGGSIRAENGPKGGATFHIALPLAAAAAKPIEAASRATA